MSSSAKTNMAEPADSEVKHFFEHVLDRTEEILHQTSNTSNEQHSEVLTHVHLM